MKLEAAWLRDFAQRYTGAWCSQEASRTVASGEKGSAE
jgi:hypothetical protein